MHLTHNIHEEPSLKATGDVCLSVVHSRGGHCLGNGRRVTVAPHGPEEEGVVPASVERIV